MYDLIIIGGSAAGVSAAIYASRRKLNFILISGDIGGEVATSGVIDNYPGFVHTDGLALTQKYREQLAANSVPLETQVIVTAIKQKNSHFTITAQRDHQAITYEAKTVLVATGVRPRELGIPGEKEFKGKGVSWCTVCDGPLYKGKTVATIGGGNSVLESALMLSTFASKIYLLNKNPYFKGERILVDKVTVLPNVEIIYEALTKEIIGNQFVTGLKYLNKKIKKTEVLSVEGVFIHIGMVPNSALVPSAVAKDQFNEIIVDQLGQTNIPGLWAAGDVTNIPYKQIAIASGQGVAALLNIVEYLNRHH